jgi:hypothetical protein
MRHWLECVSDPSIIDLGPEFRSAKTDWSRSYSRETVEMKKEQSRNLLRRTCLVKVTHTSNLGGVRWLRRFPFLHYWRLQLDP